MKYVGAPMIVTSRAMGHSDIATTANLYTDVMPAELATMAQKLDEKFRSIGSSI